MKNFSVKEIYDSYSTYMKKYVSIVGYYDGDNIKDIESSSNTTILIDSNGHFHTDIKQLLKKIELTDYVGNMRVVGKLGSGMTPKKNIGQIIKIDILDEDYNVINSSSLNKDSIPKEIREEL